MFLIALPPWDEGKQRKACDRKVRGWRRGEAYLRLVWGSRQKAIYHRW